MKSKMSVIVCMFDKFGFCKWNTSCTKVHLKENCLLEECESRKCQKRHPRPCKFNTERGYCKYGENCRFDHRPPKYLRSLVSRLKALEKENKKLTNYRTEPMLLKMIRMKRVQKGCRNKQTNQFLPTRKRLNRLNKLIKTLMV